MLYKIQNIHNSDSATNHLTFCCNHWICAHYKIRYEFRFWDEGEKMIGENVGRKWDNGWKNVSFQSPYDFCHLFRTFFARYFSTIHISYSAIRPGKKRRLRWCTTIKLNESHKDFSPIYRLYTLTLYTDVDQAMWVDLLFVFFRCLL